MTLFELRAARGAVHFLEAYALGAIPVDEKMAKKAVELLREALKHIPVETEETK
ncbi:hypothetical protein [Rhizobacter sp. Root404]|uniref:hypothetical protein n=1 Tax=Rhizobacter sp. Root404 TaxID=1736528 RepID=UPI000A5829FB|nr:hypothetical protein [Rhizobacter sp. Root404]